VSLTALALNTKKGGTRHRRHPDSDSHPGRDGDGFLTINELSGGRAIAGLGVSSPVIVERWHGASYRKPVTAMRDVRDNHASAIQRGPLECRRRSLQIGFFASEDAHNRATAAEDYLAGLNAPMLRLAGEIADGVLMNYSPPEAIAPMVQHIHEGAKVAGREPSAVDVGIYIRMCITDDEDKAVDSFRRELAGYAFVDSYNKMFARYGLAAEFDEVRRLWKEGQARRGCQSNQRSVVAQDCGISANARRAVTSSRTFAPRASRIR